MKILLIVCLVLGVALMALWGYVQLNADAIADISARVDAYKQAQAPVEAARGARPGAAGGSGRSRAERLGKPAPLPQRL